MNDKSSTATESTASGSANKKTSSNKKTLTKSSADIAVQPKSRSSLALLSIGLVLATAVAGYWAFNQLQQQIKQLSVQSEGLQDDNQQLSQRLDANIASLDAGLSKQLNNLQLSSSEKFELLQNQVGKSRRQWLIAEAEYLSSLANTRLQLAGDINTAIIALQAADQRLKENGDPTTFAVREQLAKEINILKSTAMPDTVGISSQLIALENAVAKMGISEPHAGTAQAPEIGKGEASPIPENIQQTLNEAWSNFSKLVVVRRHDKPIAALMTPEQIELIRKNLALKLEAARLALINKDENLYNASIAISIDWLSDYFDAAKPRVKAAIEQLESLKNTPIKAQLPSISLSLKMLRKLPLLSMNETITAPVESTTEEENSQPSESPQAAKVEPASTTPIKATP